VGAREFPLDVTNEEDAFGFTLSEAPSGTRALVVPLPSGLRAVKVRTDDGAIQYVVCDENLQPLYVAATTLDDLRERFARRGRTPS
jgi:hypothetical protein